MMLTSDIPRTYGLEEKVEYKTLCLGLEFAKVRVSVVITTTIRKKDAIGQAKGR